MFQHSMIELEGWLASLGPVAFSFRNDNDATLTSITDLQLRLLELQSEGETIQATADGEKRDLTEAESDEIEKVFAEFQKVELDIGRRERMEANAQRLGASQGRRTEPGDLIADGLPVGGPVAVRGPTIAPQPSDFI